MRTAAQDVKNVLTFMAFLPVMTSGLSRCNLKTLEERLIFARESVLRTFSSEAHKNRRSCVHWPKQKDDAVLYRVLSDRG
jgi:hypothetical protein